MRFRTSTLAVPLGALLVAALLQCSVQAQTKRALLIGIDTYRPKPLPPLPADLAAGHKPGSRWAVGRANWRNLQGPLNDVASMQFLLQKSFGFTDIRLLTNSAATRQGILNALDALIRRTRPGDLDVFYFSGHGSLRVDSKSSKPDHMDETIVPADAYLGVYDIRDKELAHKFNQILARKARLVAIFDSCHSGTQARGPGIARALPYDDRDVANDPHAYVDADLTHVPAQGNAVLLTASLSNEQAVEMSFPEGNKGVVHGILTQALIQVLRVGGNWPAVDVLNSVQELVRAKEPDQHPTIEGDTKDALFGGATAQPLRAVVTYTQGETDWKGAQCPLLPGTAANEVHLDIGSLAGFGSGTEFTSLGKDPDGQHVVLAVTSVDTPVCSTAKVVSGAKPPIPGDAFELTRFVPAPESKLRVFVPGLGSSSAERLTIAAAKARFRLIKWVEDPADSPRYLIAPTRAGWLAFGPGDNGLSPMLIGRSTALLTAPVPAGLVAALQKLPAVKDGAIILTGDWATSPDYMLLAKPEVGRAPLEVTLASTQSIGTPPAGGYVINEEDNDPNSNVACANSTSYPIRGPWVVASPGGYAPAAKSLDTFAARLAHLHTWMNLAAESQPPDLADWPYRPVILVHDGDRRETLTPGRTLAPNTQYDISLVSADVPQFVDRHFVYLYGFDCSAHGALLYPPLRMNGGAEQPMVENPAPRVISLMPWPGGPPESVGAPYGADTIFVLLSPMKITNLSVLDGGLPRGFGSVVQQIVVPSRSTAALGITGGAADARTQGEHR